MIYTTALPPACDAAALAALRIVRRADGKGRRERVMKLAERVREELEGMGFDCGGSVTPIVPVMMGSAERALAAAERLKEKGDLGAGDSSADGGGEFGAAAD